MLGLLPLSLALARPALLRPSARAPRTAAIELRIKNSASEGAAEWNKNPSLKPPKKTIAPDQPDLNSPSATFDALCRMCGVAEGREVEGEGRGRWGRSVRVGRASRPGLS